jgi:hypothetical protein
LPRDVHLATSRRRVGIVAGRPNRTLNLLIGDRCMKKKHARLLQFRHHPPAVADGGIDWPAVLKTLEAKAQPQADLDEFLAEVAVSLWSLKQDDSKSAQSA